jgi:hypothetical protein
MSLRDIELVVEAPDYQDSYEIVWEGIKLAFNEGRVVVVKHKGIECRIDPWDVRNKEMKGWK